ncbi:MAG: serine/threonine-protein kinase [Elusimicrobiota bacterium]
MGKYWAIINNQYLVIRKIGTGGFATVYRAWDSMLQKIVAIKKIHREFSSNAKYVDMFRKEAINTAKLEHENIVRVVNFVKDQEGGFYIVMDYVKGVDLEYLIEKCKRNIVNIPVDIALFITSEVLKALDYAHAIRDELTDRPLNITHRDISPGNVMLYFDSRIKLTDFGIAKVGEESNIAQRSEKGKLKGKISYMSPEQADGKTDLDPRSDLFSCGIILYEVLTGEKAFDGEVDVDTWQKVRKANIDFKKLKEKKIPDEIQKILKKVLQRSPDRRYQNAAEMFIEIKRYLSKKGTTEELMKDYKSFIQDLMAIEIGVLDEEMERDSKLDFRSVFSKSENAGMMLDDLEEESRQEADEELDVDVNIIPENLRKLHEQEEEQEEEIAAEDQPANNTQDIEKRLAEAMEGVGIAGQRKEKEPAEEQFKSADIEDIPESKEETEDEEKPAEDPEKEMSEKSRGIESEGAQEPQKKTENDEKPETDKAAAAETAEPDNEEEPEEEAEKTLPEEPAGMGLEVEEEPKVKKTEDDSPETSPADEHVLDVGEFKVSVEDNEGLPEQELSEEEREPYKPDSYKYSPEYKRKRLEIIENRSIFGNTGPVFSESADEKEKSLSGMVMQKKIESETRDKEMIVKKHRKKRFFSLIVMGLLLLGGLIALDISVQYTYIGSTLRNILWPSGLKIASRPSGANIEIIVNGMDYIKKFGLSPKTPVYLQNLEMDAYKLRLTKKEYAPVIRILNIFDDKKGGRNIFIPGSKSIKGGYEIPFTVEIEIKSLPVGAAVSINGEEVGITPYFTKLEMGEHSIYVKKMGFGSTGSVSEKATYALGMCVLNTMKPAKKQTKIDKTLWDVDYIINDAGRRQYIVTCNMRRTNLKQ